MPEPLRRDGDAAGLLGLHPVVAQQPVAEMPQDDAAWLLPSYAASVASERRIGERLGEFPPAAAHSVLALVMWPWANSRQ
jgi:hypothetical protein